jgi:signal transduction histidine kinase
MSAVGHIGRYRYLPSSPATLAAVTGIVFACVYASIRLTMLMDQMSTIWVANAVLLSFVMKRRRREWPGLLAAGWLGNALANLVAGYPPLPSLIFPFLNIAEVLMIAIPLRRLRYDREFARQKPLLLFYALALGPAAMLPALLSATYFHSLGAPFFHTALNWYAADALGLAIVVPPLMTVKLSALRAMFRRDQLAVSLLLIGLVVAVAAMNFIGRQYPVAFLFFPAVFLITFQRGFAGGAIGLLITALYMISPVLLGDVSIALKEHSIREQMMVVQIFVAVTGLSVVMMGAALDERKRLARRLADAITLAETAREEAIVSRDAAVQASRAKSMFLANMSHELRTPLNAVIGFAELMHGELFGPLGDKRYRDYTSRIQDAGRHLLDLINDILDMSKIEAGKMELERRSFSLDAQVRECLELMQDRASQAQIELAADLPPGTLPVYVDQRATRQILLNLLSNAIKFTPSHGRVVARARIVNGEVTLSVRDTGYGIPADRIDALGNPFVQLRSTAGETHKGTGLGLALVKNLAQLHGGDMRIESCEGKGSTITVTFPAGDVALAA